MNSPSLLTTLLKLQSEVDTEAISLLVRFVDRAIGTGDPKAFLKGVLRAVVETPEDDKKVQIVEVKVLPAKGKTSGR